MNEHQHPDAKPLMVASPPASLQASCKRYPVSSKAYRRKDYEYISSFNFTPSSNLKATRANADHLHQRFDAQSDCSLTQSSIDSHFSSTFSSSRSSASIESYGKGSDSRDFENHVSDNFSSLHVAENNREPQSKMDESDTDETRDSYPGESCVAVKDVGAEVCRPEAKPDQEKRQPIVLPRSTACNRRDLSSAEAYFDVFGKSTNEEKSEGLPVSPSSSGNVDQELHHHIRAQSSKLMYGSAKAKHSSELVHNLHENKSSKPKNPFLLMLKRSK